MLEVSGEECPMIAIILLHWTLIVGSLQSWDGLEPTVPLMPCIARCPASNSACLPLANRISEANLTV